MLVSLRRGTYPEDHEKVCARTDNCPPFPRDVPGMCGEGEGGEGGESEQKREERTMEKRKSE